MKLKDYPLSVRNLVVAYEEKPVLYKLDLDVPKGCILGIVGPNGAGKSTLIKSVLGLIKPLTGEVKFFGEDYLKFRQSIAYVPQKGSVDWDFPTDVLDVVLMGRYGHIGFFKRPSKADVELAMNAIKEVGMEKFAKRQIDQLSGGQKQRVFLARALVQNADIYFMDEPFQGVDAKTEKSIIHILKKLKNDGKTLIVVHHDLETVKDYFDRVCLLNVKIIASGETESTFTDENIKKTYKTSNDVLKELEK